VVEIRAKVRLYKDLLDECVGWQQGIHAVLFHHGVPAQARLLAGERERLAQVVKGDQRGREELLPQRVRQSQLVATPFADQRLCTRDRTLTVSASGLRRRRAAVARGRCAPCRPTGGRLWCRSWRPEHPAAPGTGPLTAVDRVDQYPAANSACIPGTAFGLDSDDVLDAGRYA
jgi:hypothetical protein